MKKYKDAQNNDKCKYIGTHASTIRMKACTVNSQINQDWHKIRGGAGLLLVSGVGCRVSVDPVKRKYEIVNRRAIGYLRSAHS